MTRPRTPPLWLVVLPAIVLATVGVRAVTAEMSANEDAARERARSVAARLARSVDALVEEYAAPLPKAGKVVAAADDTDQWTSHLEPRAVFDVGGIAPSPDPKVSGRLEPVRLSVWDFQPEGDRALVRDALATAERLVAPGGGEIAAAALLDGAASALRPGVLHWALRTAEARYRLLVADRDAAITAVERAVASSGAGSFELDGAPIPETALELAVRALGDREPPPWLVQALERCATAPLFLDGPDVEPVLNALPASLEARLGPMIRLRRDVRTLTKTPQRQPLDAAHLGYAQGTLRLTLWRAVASPTGWRVVGGEVPEVVVRDRVVAESAALLAESGVASIRLVGGGVSADLAMRDIRTSPRGGVVESVALAAPLAAWRAEVVVSPDAAVPASAFLLAAAVAVTTLALVAGLLALRRSAERSARLAEDRQTFLDHVAHELRSPAAAVQALTEELASGHVTAEREGEYRQHLLRESRRLSSLVEDTLDLTRLDAGRLAFKMEPADLRDVVRRAVEESDGSGRVVAKLPDQSVVRAVDEGALRRAVKNLVENAVRHGGGDAPVTVTLEARNGAATIAVTDQGRGIAAEHLPRLFERFYRVPSATHETKGVGLGLALCREVARAHGGEVEVESRVGKGSTFTLRVPL